MNVAELLQYLPLGLGLFWLGVLQSGKNNNTKNISMNRHVIDSVQEDVKLMTSVYGDIKEIKAHLSHMRDSQNQMRNKIDKLYNQ